MISNIVKGQMCPYCLGQKYEKTICIESGKAYDTNKDISMDLGVSTGVISKVLKGKQKTIKGYRLKYFEN